MHVGVQFSVCNFLLCVHKYVNNNKTWSDPGSYLRRCNTMPHTARHCNTVQYTAIHCNTNKTCLNSYSQRCNTLQHTVTHYNTLRQQQDLFRFVLAPLLLPAETARAPTAGCVLVCVHLHMRAYVLVTYCPCLQWLLVYQHLCMYMGVHVCACLYTYMYMYACWYSYLYVCMYAYKYKTLYIYIYLYMYVYIYTHMSICI